MKYSFSCTNYLLALLIMTGLTSCQRDAKPENNSSAKAEPSAMTPQEEKAVAVLQWLNNGNPEQDASNEFRQAGEQSRKPKLMAFAGRGLSYPGLSKDQLAATKDKVSYKIAEGSGDVIYGSAHREMRKKLRAYTVTYNQAILAAIQ